ncbi:MAG: hypothetical protein FJ314_08765 [SAR202 cluster bacterium]|nr:hypothetical protein [SAR202 cluster bacterium]
MGSSVSWIALRKLVPLDATPGPADLHAPTGNRLKKPAGNRIGFYSIRVNDQWRICSRWKTHAAYEVDLVDYLRGRPV